MKRLIIGLSILLTTILVLAGWQYFSFYDNKLHVIFCNVGQGDGILIKTPNNRTMLVDAGSDKSILTCLSEHMPFWLHTIEFLILTDPQMDHYGGMHYVIDRYNINYFISENLRSKDPNYKYFQQQLKNNNLSEIDVLSGSNVHFTNGFTVTFLGPSKSYLAQSSSNQVVGESTKQACLVSLLTYKTFSALLTCNSQVVGLTDAFQEWSARHVDILGVPYHGSKYGLDKQIVAALSPQISIVSVSKNLFGQPNPQVLKLLEDEGSKVFRTDKKGTIEIVTNGKGFNILTSQ